MNLSLRNRVAASFIFANLVVLILSFTVFNFLNSLNKDIENITLQSNRMSLLTDEIRISAVSILKYQRRLLARKSTPELIKKIIDRAETLTAQLQTLDTLNKDVDVKKVVTQMLSYVDSLKIVLSKSSLFHRDSSGMASIGELADKILDAYGEFQDIQFFQSQERDKKINSIINETKKNMMMTLVVCFLGTIILGLVVPGKIALPFKKIKDAIRELQDCNFDVSIYYSQDDEIGEIANEMNKMIHSFKVFEELRTDRILVEHRKFDALANMIKKPVLVANADGKLIYMNNQLYSLMQVQSEDVIGKTMTDTVIPPTIIESYELAIKRRSKIENAEIVIPLKNSEQEESDTETEVVATEVVAEDDSSQGEKDDKEKDEACQDIVFKGYASVIPIRGKQSSLDYYLMVISKEVYT